MSSPRRSPVTSLSPTSELRGPHTEIIRKVIALIRHERAESSISTQLTDEEAAELEIGLCHSIITLGTEAVLSGKKSKDEFNAFVSWMTTDSASEVIKQVSQFKQFVRAEVAKFEQQIKQEEEEFKRNFPGQALPKKEHQIQLTNEQLKIANLIAFVHDALLLDDPDHFADFYMRGDTREFGAQFDELDTISSLISPIPPAAQDKKSDRPQFKISFKTATDKKSEQKSNPLLKVKPFLRGNYSRKTFADFLTFVAKNAVQKNLTESFAFQFRMLGHAFQVPDAKSATGSRFEVVSPAHNINVCFCYDPVENVFTLVDSNDLPTTDFPIKKATISELVDELFAGFERDESIFINTAFLAKQSAEPAVSAFFQSIKSDLRQFDGFYATQNNHETHIDATGLVANASTYTNDLVLLREFLTSGYFHSLDEKSQNNLRERISETWNYLIHLVIKQNDLLLLRALFTLLPNQTIPLDEMDYAFFQRKVSMVDELFEHLSFDAKVEALKLRDSDSFGNGKGLFFSALMDADVAMFSWLVKQHRALDKNTQQLLTTLNEFAAIANKAGKLSIEQLCLRILVELRDEKNAASESTKPNNSLAGIKPAVLKTRRSRSIDNGQPQKNPVTQPEPLEPATFTRDRSGSQPNIMLAAPKPADVKNDSAATAPTTQVAATAPKKPIVINISQKAPSNKTPIVLNVVNVAAPKITLFGNPSTVQKSPGNRDRSTADSADDKKASSTTQQRQAPKPISIQLTKKPLIQTPIKISIPATTQTTTTAGSLPKIVIAKPVSIPIKLTPQNAIRLWGSVGGNAATSNKQDDANKTTFPNIFVPS